MLRIAVAGCHGRMGKSLVQTAANHPGVRVCAATVSPRHALRQLDVGEIAGISPLHIKPVEDLAQVLEQFDVLIDFTTPSATLSHLKLCLKQGKKIVIGTTGFNAEQSGLIFDASRDLPIVCAPNMSVGVNLSLGLLTQAAKVLGKNFQVAITESHHRAKVDAPSGTALQMGEVMQPYCESPIQYASIRAGDIVGDHTVIFAGDGERLEITHRATSRETFAQGALRAALWLENQKPGLYTLSDVLFN